MSADPGPVARAAALDHRVGLSGDAPAVEALAGWAAEVAGMGPALGLDPASLPAAEWRDLLAWAGVPLAAGGALRWGTDLCSDPAAARVEERGGVLVLPPPAALPGLSSLALKPLRRWIAARIGVRLQSATGVRLWAWPDRAVVLSLAAVPLGGFLYGPVAGHRTTLALDPGGWQAVVW